MGLQKIGDPSGNVSLVFFRYVDRDRTDSFLAIIARPGILVAASMLLRHVKSPTMVQQEGDKRVLRYLKNTMCVSDYGYCTRYVRPAYSTRKFKLGWRTLVWQEESNRIYCEVWRHIYLLSERAVEIQFVEFHRSGVFLLI